MKIRAIEGLPDPTIRLDSGDCAIVFRGEGIKIIVPTSDVDVASDSFMVALGVVHCCSDSEVGAEIRKAISQIMMTAYANGDGVAN